MAPSTRDTADNPTAPDETTTLRSRLAHIPVAIRPAQRSLGVLVIILLVTSSSLTALAAAAITTQTASASPPVRGNARIFVASDHDPTVLGTPGGGRQGYPLHDAATAGHGRSPGTLASSIDTYAYTTTPATKISIHGTPQTLESYRLNQLSSVHRTNTTSHWPASAPPRKNSTFIKDGFIAYMGATHGVQVNLPGASTNGQYLLAPNGSILEYVDYRVNLPSSSTQTHYVTHSKTVTLHIPAPKNNSTNPVKTVSKTVTFTTLPGNTITRRVSVTGEGPKTVNRTVRAVVGGHRTITQYHLTSQRVDRHLQIGGKEWSTETTPQTPPRAARNMTYAHAPPANSRQQRLRLTATIHIAARIAHRHYTYYPTKHSWKHTRTVNDSTGDSLTVSDHRTVNVVDPNSISLSQHVIHQQNGKELDVLSIHGPQSLTKRALWTWAAFSKSGSPTTPSTLLTNTWEVYAVRQYRHGGWASNQHPRPRRAQFPPTLALRVTARSPNPSIMAVGNTSSYTGPHIARTRHQSVPGVSRPASLGKYINLSSVTANETTQVVIKNAPGNLSHATTIFGTSIPITTTTYGMRKPSRLDYHVIPGNGNNSTPSVRLHLTSSSGIPLRYRTIILTGAKSQNVTTNATGYATAMFSGATITARFPGDPYTNNQVIYYDSSHISVTRPTHVFLVTGIWSFFFRPVEAALLTLTAIVGLFVGVAYFVSRGG